MYYTDDPERDYDRYMEDREAQLDKLPTCCDCGEPIQDEYFYNIDGDFYCEECLKSNFRRSVEAWCNDN